MAAICPHEQSIFEIARKIDSREARDAYLQQICGGDAAVAQRVRTLLAAHDENLSFLEAPAADRAYTLDSTAFTERIGAQIGPYKLMEQIGEGGMGLVFVAEQHHPIRRKVALKLIKPGMDTRQVIARFEAERQALALMNHPNIARVFDGGETPSGRPYFVMEFVKGVPITEYCDQNRLPPRARLELFRQVCAAVQHAHQKGVIHRDIKPSNVIVSSHDGTPVVKVIDFGVAKAIGQQLTDKTIYTQVVQFVGTPLYMSPEQAGQSDLDIDTRSDVYALGVLLYELLTGTTPFDKDRLKDASYDEIRRIIREEEPPKPSTRMSTLNQQAGSTVSAERQIAPRALSLLLRGELDWIVMKSLEKDRNRRYGSASDLEADIERFLKDQPVHACPPSRRYLLGRFIRRNRKNLLTASAFLAAALALIVGGGYWFWSRAATVEAVERDWAEAESFWKEKQWAKAQLALERASGRLVGSGLNALQAKVAARRRDVAMVARLDNALLQVLTDVLDSNAGDWIGVSKAYQTAFVEYGLDVTSLAREESAKRIRASEIRVRLIQGLEDWANAADRIQGPNAQQLREIAELADDDPWRQRLRTLRRSKNRVELEHLAESSEAAGQPQDNVARLYDLLYDAGAHEAAIVFLRKAQQLNPADFWINVDLGRALMKDSATAGEAVGFLRAALVVQPESPFLHHCLADALEKHGMQAEADVARRRAIDLYPDLGFNHRFIGGRLMAQRKWLEAEAAFRKAIALRPNYGWGHINLGQALAAQGNYTDAEAAFRKAIMLDPKNGEPHLFLGRMFLGQKKLAEAEAAYRDGIDKIAKSPDPKLASPYYLELGAALFHDGKLDEAIAAWQKAIALKPTYALAYNNLGVALKQQNKLAEAEVAFHKSVALALRNADSLEDAAERTDSRTFALQMLRADMSDVIKKLESDRPKEAPGARQLMERWNRDPDFASVRGEEALALLPAAERPAWRSFWQDVATLKIGAIPHFIRSWLVLSELVPYSGRDGAKALDEQPIPGEALLRPQAGDRVEVNGKTLLWKEYRCKDVDIDFAELYGPPSEYRMAYAVCYVHANADHTDLVLRAGGDDQAKVYINGAEVYRQPKARPLLIDQDEVQPITLRKGINVLVFKVVNQGGAFAGSLRVLTKDGSVPEGIEFRLSP